MDVDTQLYKDVGSLQADVKTLKESAVSMDAKLDRVLAHIESDKGSKRAWSTVGAVAGSVAGMIGGAAVSWFVGSKP